MNQNESNKKGILALKEELEKELKESANQIRNSKNRDTTFYFGGRNDIVRYILLKLEGLQ